MTFIKSKATKQDIAEYTEGSCHNFATAIHAHTGWPLLVVYEKSIPSVIGKLGDTLYAVKHVASLDPDGYVWDITGRVDRNRAAAHFKRFIHFNEVGFEIIDDPAGLQKYIGFGDHQDLAEQYQLTIEWADRDARRALRGMEILPPPDEMQDRSALDESGLFREKYSVGIRSANLAVALASHFTYPIVAAFEDDGTLVRAWVEDFNGRPITADGILDGYEELEGIEGTSMMIWETPRHFIADRRLRKYLGWEALDVDSALNALAAAKSVFPSIVDKEVGGRWCTQDVVSGSVSSVIEDKKYDREFGDLKKYARKGKVYHPLAAPEAGSGMPRP